MKTNTNTRILKKTNVVGEAVKPFDSREPSWLSRDQIYMKNANKHKYKKKFKHKYKYKYKYKKFKEDKCGW